jgi:hypothetical protein
MLGAVQICVIRSCTDPAVLLASAGEVSAVAAPARVDLAVTGGLETEGAAAAGVLFDASFEHVDCSLENREV